MQRSFERSNGRGDRRMHVGKSSGSDTRRKRGSVQFVIGVENQGDVESAFGGLRRSCAVQQQEEIRRMRKRRIGLDDILPFPQAIVSRHYHRYLRSQPNRLAHVGGMVVVLLFRIVKAE